MKISRTSFRLLRRLHRVPPINLLQYPFCPSDRIGNCANGGRNTCPAVVLRQPSLWRATPVPALDFYPERGICFRVHHKHKHLPAWADPYSTGVLYL
jgi:hypothetical protein